MEGISLGPLFLRWNGILLALGIAFGVLLFALEVNRRKLDLEVVYYLFMPLLIWGLIGARLWHIFTPPLSSVQLGLTTRHYLSNPLDMLAFWIGGYGFAGALLAGILVLVYFSRKYELPFWDLVDSIAPGVALAQAVGRVGNYFNQELYGLPADLPWGIFIPPASRLPGYEAVEFYHPLFAYEALLNLANAVFLLWLARRFAEKLQPGDVFLVYLGFYSLVRFLLEFLRLDVALAGGLNVNQAFFGVTFVAAAAVLFRRHRPRREL
ncbi:MAG: prolipoprotein diacylglyceryl transferase [Chloroflexi bacterium]|nr:prolipoprotein diacylglyceryl transferase [Chloroflexota bacterium]MDL1942959.1 prolipoprotein diacylglyceryl transferase [Chloroflexi bacterium CFX2]